MDKYPLVTVGVASCNNAQYIGETLDSIANQTYKNIELIIVDDCSTDDSVVIINKWIKNNSQILVRLIINMENEGISKTFAKLIKNAKGEFITTVGSDDNFLPFKITRFVQAFSELADDYALVYSDAFLIKPNGSRRYGRFIQRYRQFENVPSGNIYEELLEGNFIPAMATMIKKEAIIKIGGIDETLAYEDYDLWLRLAKNFKFHFVDEETVEYRIHSNSITSLKTDFWVEANFLIFSKHFPHPIAKEKYINTLYNSYQQKKWAIVNKWANYYVEITNNKVAFHNWAKWKISPLVYRIYKKINSSI